MALTLAGTTRGTLPRQKRKCKASILAGGPAVSDAEYETAYAKTYGHAPFSEGGTILRNVTGLEINNNVFTVSVRHPLDLDKLLKHTAHMGAEYSKRKKFPSLGLHFAADARNSRAAVSIFGTGKIVCLGSESAAGALAVLHVVRDILETCHPDIGLLDIMARNVVGTMYTDLSIDIRVLCCYVTRLVERRGGCYDPPRLDTDAFPGMQWCNPDGIQYLIFPSGTVVLTNGKRKEDIFRGAAYILDIIQKCKSDHPSSVQYTGV